MINFTKNLDVRWSDVDANLHMTHTAYAMFATQTRIGWLDNIGFSLKKIMDLGYAGVLLKEETEYFRELLLGDTARVDLVVAGLSEDYSYWKFIYNIYAPSGKLSARHMTLGVWVNMNTRKISVPPTELRVILDNLRKEYPCEVIGRPRIYQR